MDNEEKRMTKELEALENQIECPHCLSKEVIKIYRPEVYEFHYICRNCDMGFN